MAAHFRPCSVAESAPWGVRSWQAFSAWEIRILEFASGFGMKKAVFDR
jgi:hypothetical protein